MEPIIETTASSRSDRAARLRARLAGAVLQPGDAGYDAARRVWNGMIDRRPALIARCTGDDDVAACVRFAREAGMALSVRGGGHNVAGSAVCDGGLVVDLSAMRGVRVDAAARRAVAEGGATIGDLDRATQAYGLAAPMGVVTETGVAGLTLGGGLGWLRRKHGLSCDALRAVTVVTAGGERLRASADEHADLFWAVRGGGGNFGVVTAFEYELYEVSPEVFRLVVFYPIDAARAVLRHLRAYMATAPDAFSPLGVLAHVPPMDGIPARHHGAPCLVVVGPYAGDPAEGERLLAPLRRLAAPLADLSGRVSYLEMQRFFDEDYPSGGRYYWKSIQLDGLADDAIDRLIDANDAAPAAHSTIDIWFQGGAMSRVGAAETAFGDRSAPILIGVEANWHDPAGDEANVAWARACVDAMRPFSDGRAYLNFPGSADEGARAMRATYGANYDRLVALKRRYDPDDVFRTHQRIDSAG